MIVIDIMTVIFGLLGLIYFNHPLGWLYIVSGIVMGTWRLVYTSGKSFPTIGISFCLLTLYLRALFEQVFWRGF